MEPKREMMKDKYQKSCILVWEGKMDFLRPWRKTQLPHSMVLAVPGTADCSFALHDVLTLVAYSGAKVAY